MNWQGKANINFGGRVVIRSSPKEFRKSLYIRVQCI